MEMHNPYLFLICTESSHQTTLNGNAVKYQILMNRGRVRMLLNKVANDSDLNTAQTPTHELDT
jgi:hypothetical protein